MENHDCQKETGIQWEVMGGAVSQSVRRNGTLLLAGSTREGGVGVQKRKQRRMLW